MRITHLLSLALSRIHTDRGPVLHGGPVSEDKLPSECLMFLTKQRFVQKKEEIKEI